jgi:hypothetical protein
MDKIYIAQSWLGELSTAPWGVISDKFVLDEKEWYNKLQPGANEGANVCRVLPFSLFGNASPEAVFQPFKYVGNGQWDLSQYNDHYFPVMRKAIEIAKSLGVKIWLELFDHCGLWNKPGESVLHLNPWANNIQGYENFYTPSEFITQYVNRMLAEFGDTVLWGLGNELTESHMIKTILSAFKGKGIVPFSYGADLDIPGEENHNSVRKAQAMEVERVWGENEKIQLFHCCHKACDWTSERVTKPVFWWAYHSIAFSDDGAFPRPDGAQWAETIEYVLNNQNMNVPQFGQSGKARLLFEHCPEAPNSELVIRGMVAECERYGATFANKGNIMPWVDPVKPEPELIPEPAKPVWNWRGWWNNNSEAVFASVLVVIILVVLLILTF